MEIAYASWDRNQQNKMTFYSQGKFQAQEVTGVGVSVNFDVTGVNRDVSAQTGVWEGKEISPINISPGTEYWLTGAGVGKANT